MGDDRAWLRCDEMSGVALPRGGDDHDHAAQDGMAIDVDPMAGASGPLHLSTDPAALLLHEGNLAFQSGSYESAIEIYTRALQLESSDTALMYSNRCAAFCRMAQSVKLKPAAESERNAQYGLDLTALAQLALRDADKLLQMRKDWPRAYLRRGTALILLEQYEDALSAFLSGLELDPNSRALQEGLRRVRKELVDEMRPSSTGAAHTRDHVVRTDEFDCSLCLKLFYSPVTTPCGHTFCRACLCRALDHGNRCPVCRTVLFVSARSYPVNVTLNAILEKFFQEETAERKAETDAASVLGTEILPLFVLDVVIPGQKMALNIFEPRYRLMIRRAMEGDHRMGILGIDATTHLPTEVACEVEICECEPLPDGRFFIVVEGRRRCRIVRGWEQDGYRVGQVEWLTDDKAPEGSPESQRVQTLAAAAANLAQDWMARNQEAAPSRRRLAERMRQAGEMPPTSQPEQLSFWLANLLILNSNEKLAVLQTTNTAERLLREMEYLRADHPSGCRLQ